MSRPEIVNLPYGYGTVSIRLDRIDAVVVKPKAIRGSDHVDDSDPWIMQVDTVGHWYQVEYSSKKAAYSAAVDLTQQLGEAHARRV